MEKNKVKQVMVVKPGSLSPKDKEKLTKHSIVVIEHENPDEIKIITMMDSADSELILKAAIDTITYSSYDTVREKFGQRVANAMSKALADPTPSTISKP